MDKINKKIKVVELFAGVGGFRVGLEKSSDLFDTIWANQWEPSKKLQHAYNCYISHFGKTDTHVNEDISIAKVRVPAHDLLVGGFPCQDYSVAQSGAKGIEGKKGVLWWEIRDIIDNHHPNYILLENVDRLVKSPASQRGRDFAIILRCLYDLGYAVEWRVINAADYGYSQRRRRIFIFAYKNTTKLFKKLSEVYSHQGEIGLNEWIKSDGFYAKEFRVNNIKNKKKYTFTSLNEFDFPVLHDVSNDFKAEFFNSGVMINGVICSEELVPIEITTSITLGEICHKNEVDSKYFIDEEKLEKWKYLKGAKKIARVKPNGEDYFFSEGGMVFPDALDKPARTMLTSESSVNRSSHAVEDFTTKKLRVLTPVECERLNGFDDNWTNTGMPHKFRYFTMGNALVVPLITRIGTRILEIE